MEEAVEGVKGSIDNLSTNVAGKPASGQVPADESQRLSVVVPCFNEFATLEPLIDRVRQSLPNSQIILIDDGSTDGSRQLGERIAAKFPLDFDALKCNRGKGAAVRRGLELADRDFVIIQDADLEYEPSDIVELLRHAIETNAVTYGSRYLNRGRSTHGSRLNYYGVKVLGILLRCVQGRRLSDPHTCYKLLPTQLARQLDIQSNGFELCAELNSKLLASGHPIDELPIRYNARTVREGKKIGWRDFFQAARTYLRYAKVRR